MSIEIRVPTLGESIVDATIASWLKNEGDTIHQGDALVELETDKVNVEVNAEQDGILQKVVKQVGVTVAVGEILGLIAEGAGGGSSQAAQSTTNGAKETVASTNSISSPPHTAPAESAAPVSPVQLTAAQQQQVQQQAPLEVQRPPSPLARRVAAEHNVDIAQVRGTSPHGRVTRDDVVNYLEQNSQQDAKSPAAPEPTAQLQVTAPVIPPASTPRATGNGTSASPTPTIQRGREERIRISRRRQTIGQRLVEAQHTAAMLTTFNEVDMTAIIDVRNRRKDAFKERNGISLGFMSFFTKAAIGALKTFPRLNAEIQGNEFVLKHYYDIGIAVGAEEGLVVPVLRDAESKSFAQIEREISELAKKARANTLSLSELQGGTFTITNGGVFGSLLSTPILNTPQVGILGMHKIEQRPIALNGQVVIRPMMYLALSYDHRIVDGREAVQFLVRIKELVEDPETLLLEG
ncbi:MAG: 2-oxoglutarate dehydrogenase complex dihydrolipoyllysine-residue succinyltransferase [Ktedonobacteraceae bacterium]